VRFALTVASILACAGVSFGQLTPDAPVANFRLPMFGDDGYRIWELTGTEGRYISPEKIEVENMKLKVFASDESGKMEHMMESPKAILLVSKNIAIGNSPITISSDTYKVEGNRWYWDGKTHSIVVSQNAKVSFFENLK
jgi:hypothetical protein